MNIERNNDGSIFLRGDDPEGDVYRYNVSNKEIQVRWAGFASWHPFDTRDLDFSEMEHREVLMFYKMLTALILATVNENE